MQKIITMAMGHNSSPAILVTLLLCFNHRREFFVLSGTLPSYVGLFICIMHALVNIVKLFIFFLCAGIFSLSSDKQETICWLVLH